MTTKPKVFNIACSLDPERFILSVQTAKRTVGEPCLDPGTTSTAFVIADSPTVAYLLTWIALAEMKE